MPRKYNRTTNKCRFSPEELTKAIEAANNGLPIREAAARFGVPKSTVFKYLSKERAPKLVRIGNKPVIPPIIEGELVKYALEISSRFFGLTQKELRALAFEIAERSGIKHPFNKIEKLAGTDWYYGFLARHPEMSLRSPEATSLARIYGFNKTAVSKFFENLLCVNEREILPASRIYNVDETGVTTVQKPQKIMARKGQKQVGKLVSGERGCTITVVAAMSAAGNFVPPMIVFPRKRIHPALGNNAPINSVIAVSKSGWINKELFVQWLHHFIDFSRSSRANKVLLILDNHEAHSSATAIDLCKENGVILLSLPPHTSHKMQPLDRTVFGPLKAFYYRECDTFMRLHPGDKITDYQVSSLFNKAYLKAATMANAVKGFECTGIWPYNAEIFSEHEFAIQEETESDIPDMKTFSGHFEIIEISDTPENPEYNNPNAVMSCISPFELSPLPILPIKKPNKGNRRRKSSTILTDESSEFVNEDTHKEVGKCVVPDQRSKVSLKKKLQRSY
jgi:hypothetical protein